MPNQSNQFDALTRPDQTEAATEFYKQRLLDVFGAKKIIESPDFTLRGSDEPLAYDRHFRTPIKVKRLIDYIEDSDTKKYKQVETQLGSYSDPKGGSLLESGQRHIKLSPAVAKLWQENQQPGTSVLKHEILHALQNKAYLNKTPIKSKGETNTILPSLLNLLTSTKNFKNEGLAAVARLEADSKISPHSGGVKSWPATGDIQFPAHSEWLPWALTDTYPKNIKLTNTEKQGLRDFFIEDLQKRGFNKYKSLWE